ncbi:hypothetical protein P0Y35_08935 [Kiritimatiellaeota bacterium B1221]|nr:hypothetical protein [Kiritimatiellaeota bacterium B1221]
MDEFSAPPASQKGNGAGLAGFMAGTVVMYFALLGPCIRIFDHCPYGVQIVIETVYAPLEWLDGVIPGSPLSKYAAWWAR